MSVPYFRFYPTDFEADTSHLSMIEDGAYNRLLRLCWMTPGCSLPDDEVWIFRRCRARTDEEQEAIRAVLSEFFCCEKQRVFSARLMREFEHASNRRDVASKNGRLGGRPKTALKTNEKDQSNGLANQKLKKANQNQNQNHKDNISLDFEEFWSVVPRKVGKGAARAKYEAALKKTDAATLFAAMKAYAETRAGQDEQYTAHPATWLNQERWTDEPPKLTTLQGGRNDKLTSKSAERMHAFIAGARGAS